MEITSDKRIKASLPTIQYALEHGAGVILASHLGRPKGKPNAEMSLKPAAARLAELLGRPVKMAPDCIGPEVEAMLPAPGEVLLLENLRFHAGGGEERPGVREETGGAVRRVRERRVRLGAPRARLHRGHDPLRAEGRGRAADGAGAEISGHGHHQSGAAVRGDSGRREGLGQDRGDREPGQGGGQAADRRRHGVHLPEGAGRAHRQVAGGRGQGGTGEEAAGRAGRQADAAGGPRGGGGDRCRARPTRWWRRFRRTRSGWTSGRRPSSGSRP